ncbi:MAG TPA: sigma-70 family RNA polymerase sigma factor [Phycisphaerae bacterium]|nr:sigma-70 family RNA polymerase sigma factor [Phycisphaerae bacterium]
MEETDLELLHRARKGHPEAFHRLVDRYAAPLFRLATTLVKTHADAEDVVQETLTAAFRALGSFQERSSVKTWLFAICYRQAALLRRKNKNPIRMLGEDESLTADPSSLPGHGEGRGGGGGGHVAAIHTRLDVQAALAKLPEDQRIILTLREFDGLSYDEIASVLQLPRGTVESRLFRARQALREFLLPRDAPNP